MTTRIQKIRLGLFMMVSSLFAAGFIIYIVGQTLMEDWDNYYIRFTETSVSGLQIGSAVKYHGITLGSVEDISIDPEDVASIIIKITIKKGTAVKSDVRATLSPIGITGMLLIELQGGTNTASNLENEGFIKRGSSTFETITGQAEKLSEKMELLLGNAIALTGNQNRYKFENILLNLDEMSGDQNKDLISEFLQNINNLTSEST
ncbi:MAG: MCE family protein, partial [Candidatus Marinimicrobia bacterium]|nr:MCE family protein [Candidatus Neomarinimicrobiota bacterium]